jgi:hypothetical protein
MAVVVMAYVLPWDMRSGRQPTPRGRPTTRIHGKPIMPSRTSKNRTSRNVRFGTSAERRSRLRLRDLCDEVIASYRIAIGDDPISAVDRAEAAALLPRLTR